MWPRSPIDPQPSERTYRPIQAEEGQARLFDEVRYQFLLTNDRQGPAAKLVLEGNDRWDLENLIAQLKSSGRPASCTFPLRSLFRYSSGLYSGV